MHNGSFWSVANTHAFPVVSLADTQRPILIDKVSVDLFVVVLNLGLWMDIWKSDALNSAFWNESKALFLG